MATPGDEQKRNVQILGLMLAETTTCLLPEASTTGRAPLCWWSQKYEQGGEGSHRHLWDLQRGWVEFGRVWGTGNLWVFYFRKEIEWILAEYEGLWINWTLTRGICRRNFLLWCILVGNEGLGIDWTMGAGLYLGAAWTRRMGTFFSIGLGQRMDHYSG